VLSEFKRALGRVQSDFGFYIDCQANPAVALAGYDLTPDERSVLADPAKLAEVLRGGAGVSPLRITFTISGKHDWINRATNKTPPKVESVAREVEAVKRAGSSAERTDAAVRLMGLIG
jgi:hypothetical protein